MLASTKDFLIEIFNLPKTTINIVTIHSNEMWTKRPLLVTLAAVNSCGLSIIEVILGLAPELDELVSSRFATLSSPP